MKIGDQVKYRGDKKNRIGKIKTIQGSKWLQVEWSDQVILLEHIKDLDLVGPAGAVPMSKNRESKNIFLDKPSHI